MLRRGIDTETLLGAVAAYLLIGMFFAFAYKAAGEFGSVPFFGSAGHGSLSQDLFFSFVTMTTVGYGNLVPRQPRPDIRGAGGGDRAAVPRRGRREDHQQHAPGAASDPAPDVPGPADPAIASGWRVFRPGMSGP